MYWPYKTGSRSVRTLSHHLCNKNISVALLTYLLSVSQFFITLFLQVLLLTEWTVRRSNSFGGEILRTPADRPWCPHSFVYNGDRVSFPGVKQPRRGFDHPPRSSAEVKERVELHIDSPSGASWPVIG
jgi:hypothetical protein